jgi:hypothetical protein
VKGTISSGQYLTWEGGAAATVCDANWNRITELPVIAEGFAVPTGEFDCQLTADEGNPSPWLELQLMTRDEPIVVPDAQL